MAPVRLSRLQKRLLFWFAGDAQRSSGMRSRSPQELIGAVPRAKGHSSHSLRRLADHGLVVIGRTRGGQAECLSLTAAGRQKVAHLVGSYA